MCKKQAGAYLTSVINQTHERIELAKFYKESLFPEYIQVNWGSEKTLQAAIEKFRVKS